MSRIGKKPVAVPGGVKVRSMAARLRRRPQGQAPMEFRPEVTVAHDARGQDAERRAHKDDRRGRALHGLTRACAEHDGRRDPRLREAAGNRRRRLYRRRPGADAAASRRPGQRVAGADSRRAEGGLPRPAAHRHPGHRQAVGRPVCRRGPRRRKPEPYKGKGIRYLGEPVRRKQGKAMVK